MRIPKNYFQDRAVLFLLTANTFFVVLSSLTIVFRLGGSHEGLIGQYRSNLGLRGYFPGTRMAFVEFILFMLFILVFHAIMSMRVYHIKQRLARAILALGLLLIIAAAIVSNALLGLGI